MRDEMTPERLDAILDGTAAPDDDEARAMLHLAADLRGAAPGASDDLRRRVLALGEPAGQPAGAPRLPFWKRLNVMAPALGAVVAAIVAVGVISTGGGSSGDSTVGGRGGADESGQFDSAVPPAAAPAPTATLAEPAPGGLARSADTPAQITVEAGALDDALAEIETAAGGPTFITEDARTPTSATVTITVPADRDADVRRALTGIGEWEDPRALDAHTPGAPIHLRLSEHAAAP